VNVNEWIRKGSCTLDEDMSFAINKSYGVHQKLKVSSVSENNLFGNRNVFELNRHDQVMSEGSLMLLAVKAAITPETIIFS
jgi:hypothetical protein